MYSYVEDRIIRWDRITRFPLFINPTKSGIDIPSNNYIHSHRRGDYRKVMTKASKQRIYDVLFDSYGNYLRLITTSAGEEYIGGHRLLFKKDQSVITPLIVIDEARNVHIQKDILVDKFGKSFLKLFLLENVVWHDNLAKEFFIGLDVNFQSLKERSEMEDIITQLMLEEYAG